MLADKDTNNVYIADTLRILRDGCLQSSDEADVRY